MTRPDAPVAVVVGRPEGVVCHRPARRKHHKVRHGHACNRWTSHRHAFRDANAQCAGVRRKQLRQIRVMCLNLTRKCASNMAVRPRGACSECCAQASAGRRWGLQGACILGKVRMLQGAPSAECAAPGTGEGQVSTVKMLGSGWSNATELTGLKCARSYLRQSSEWLGLMAQGFTIDHCQRSADRQRRQQLDCVSRNLGRYMDAMQARNSAQRHWLSRPEGSGADLQHVGQAPRQAYLKGA